MRWEWNRRDLLLRLLVDFVVFAYRLVELPRWFGLVVVDSTISWVFQWWCGGSKVVVANGLCWWQKMFCTWLRVRFRVL